jgi:two-component system invasion response regulator UvrY
MTTAKTVLLVDDHPIVRAGCQRLLAGAGGFRVVEADRAEHAFALYAAERPDVVVMDLSMPGISGLEAMQRLLAEDPRALVLIFSMHEDPVFAAKALRAGARGYITKNDAPEVLIDAIRQVLDGGVYLDHAMARELAVMGCATPRGSLHGLTPRELDILMLLGKGMSIGGIAEVLSISEKTVYNNCTQIKDKVGARSTRDLMRISFAMQHVGADVA